MLSNESQYVLAHRCLIAVKNIIVWSALPYVAFLIIYYLAVILPSYTERTLLRSINLHKTIIKFPTQFLCMMCAKISPNMYWRMDV